MMQQSELDRVQEGGVFLFLSAFTEQSCGEAIHFITYHNMADNPLEELTIILNSPGGHLEACLGLLDTIFNSAIPVSIVALGEVASCGCILLMSGAVGRRLVSSTCLVMSHEFSGGVEGRYSHMKGTREVEDLRYQQMVNHYHKCTGLNKKYIEKHLLPNHDVWLTPERAVELGIADEVVDFYDNRRFT